MSVGLGLDLRPVDVGPRHLRAARCDGTLCGVRMCVGVCLCWCENVCAYVRQHVFNATVGVYRTFWERRRKKSLCLDAGGGDKS